MKEALQEISDDPTQEFNKKLVKIRIDQHLGDGKNVGEFLCDHYVIIKDYPKETQFYYQLLYCNYLWRSGQYKLANQETSTSIEKLRETDFAEEIVNYYLPQFIRLQAMAKFFMGDIDGAITTGLNGIQVALQRENYLQVAYLQSNLGYFLRLKGNIGLSNYYLHKALKVLRMQNVPTHLSNCLENIGMNFIKIGMAEEAVNYFEESVHYRQVVGDSFYYSWTIFHLYQLNERFDARYKMEENLKVLKSLAETSDNRVVMERYKLAKASNYLLQRRYKDKLRAHEIFTDVVNNSSGNFENKLYGLFKIADLLLDEAFTMENPTVIEELQELLDNIKLLVEESKSGDLILSLSLLMSRVALLKDDLEAALRYLNLATETMTEYGLLWAETVLDRYRVDMKNIANMKQPGNFNPIESIKIRSQLSDLILGQGLSIEPKADIPFVFLIINNAGMLIHSINFNDKEVPNHLIANFISAVSQFGNEIFADNTIETIREIKFSEYNLLIRTISGITACYIFKGQEYFAYGKLERIIREITENKSIIDDIFQDPFVLSISDRSKLLIEQIVKNGIETSSH